MFESNFDKAKNRVYVKLEGTMTIEEAKHYDKVVRSQIDKAQEDFTFCIDMINAQPAPAEVNDYLTSLREYMASKKVKGSALVTNNSVTRLQLRRLSKDLGGKSKIVLDYSEAEEFLDSL
ncbi:protein kinase [Paenibacillus alvei]|uniref:protein kinase n=1 Tax=Paenibacillus alvei TaxID=44250 RepID=UPI00227EC125|nr:protein kinase [Paenibacillus alvei]MCY9737471.1 protein kinase [Paenibacillus alvei]